MTAPSRSWDLTDARAFVLANTKQNAPPLIPEITLHLASEIVPLWQMTEAELEATGLPPPYWAFAWVGGQALARYVLDNPTIVRGRRVLDFGAGSGLAAIAAARAGARHVAASDIDRFACAAIELNAEANKAGVAVSNADLLGNNTPDVDIVLVGDMCYEQPLAGHLSAWLAGLLAQGKTVLFGDPGRSYFLKEGIAELARYDVRTTRELEDSERRSTAVFQMTARP